MPISRLPVVSLPVSTKAEFLAIATIMWAQGQGHKFVLMQFLPEMASEPKRTILSIVYYSYRYSVAKLLKSTCINMQCKNIF